MYCKIFVEVLKINLEVGKLVLPLHSRSETDCIKKKTNTFKKSFKKL